MSITLEDIAAIGDALFGIPKANATFYGDKAKSADQEKLRDAKIMEGLGKHRDEIWKQTGWGRDESGQWMWEKSDKGLALDIDAIRGATAIPAFASEISNHSYADEYPANSIGVRSMDLKPGLLGQIGDLGTLKDMQMNSNNSDSKMRETFLHEMQHAADMEQGGYGKATPPEWIPEEAHGQVRDATYKNQLNEVRARSTSARADLDEYQRRNNPPWYDRDVQNIIEPNREMTMLDIINASADVDREVYERQMRKFNEIPQSIRRL
ncbi:MAG: hypothetical protein GY750_05405 [Lentisphaerae bacterium]|nr:hypothetical protein [Lentisphaerota bacterium]MCP4337681.1 hypothetical protein [Desulfobulbaceae bacterium]